MQNFHDTQTNHYKEDLYDLDIELKTVGSSTNSHEYVNNVGSVITCIGVCQTTARC